MHAHRQCTSFYPGELSGQGRPQPLALCRLKTAKNCSGNFAPVMQRPSSLPRYALGPQQVHTHQKTPGKRVKQAPPPEGTTWSAINLRQKKLRQASGAAQNRPNTPSPSRAADKSSMGAGPAAKGCAAATTLTKHFSPLGHQKLPSKTLQATSYKTHALQDCTHTSATPSGAAAAGA
jgi:hypothetical protein